MTRKARLRQREILQLKELKISKKYSKRQEGKIRYFFELECLKCGAIENTRRDNLHRYNCKNCRKISKIKSEIFKLEKELEKLKIKSN